MTAARQFESSLSLRVLDELVNRLAPVERAELRWRPAELRASLRAFVASEKCEADVQTLAAHVLRGSSVVRMKIAAMLAREPEALSSLDVLWTSELEAMYGAMAPFVRDLAEFALAVWRAFIQRAMSELPSATAEELQASARRLDALPVHEFGTPWRLQSLLMAAVEGVNSRMPLPEISHVLGLAFDEANALRDRLNMRGFGLDPFADDSAAARGARLNGYFDHLREMLSSEDVDELADLRLRNLR